MQYPAISPVVPQLNHSALQAPIQQHDLFVFISKYPPPSPSSIFLSPSTVSSALQFAFYPTHDCSFTIPLGVLVLESSQRPWSPYPMTSSPRDLSPTTSKILIALALSAWIQGTTAEHHMKRAPVHWVNRRDSSVPLQVVNYCQEDIYPGIQTQAGTGPQQTGFLLSPGGSLNQTVSADWQGRVWGRTNCSFNAAGTAPANNAPGKACLTGDCGGTVDCKGTVSRFPYSFHHLHSDTLRVKLPLPLLNLPFKPTPAKPSTTSPSSTATMFLWASLPSLSPQIWPQFLQTSSTLFALVPPLSLPPKATPPDPLPSAQIPPSLSPSINPSPPPTSRAGAPGTCSSIRPPNPAMVYTRTQTTRSSARNSNPAYPPAPSGSRISTAARASTDRQAAASQVTIRPRQRKCALTRTAMPSTIRPAHLSCPVVRDIELPSVRPGGARQFSVPWGTR